MLSGRISCVRAKGFLFTFVLMSLYYCQPTISSIQLESSSSFAAESSSSFAAETSSSFAAETDTSALSESPLGYTTTEEGESEDSLWNRDFQSCGDEFTEPISQLSQISQASQWSNLSSTSNLDAIISFLETQDTSESNRY